MSADGFDSLAVALVGASFRVALDRPEDQVLNSPQAVAAALIRKDTGLRDQRALARAVEAAKDQLGAALEAFDSNRREPVTAEQKDRVIAGIISALAGLRLTRGGMAALGPRGESVDLLLRREAVKSWGEAGADQEVHRYGRVLMRHAAQYVRSLVSHLTTVVGEVGQVPPGMLVQAVERGLTEGVEAVRIPTAHKDVSDEVSTFESQYATAVIEAYDTMELFGIDIPEILRRQPVDVGYITLQSSTRDARHTDGTSRANVDTMIADACRVRRDRHGRRLAARPAQPAEHPRPYRVLLTGAAGSGKTTVTQWLALGAARSSFPEALRRWQDLLPFVIQLRYIFSDGKPRRLDVADLARVATRRLGKLPADWLHERLDQGRALVILDGFDELPPLPHRHRHDVYQWIKSLITQYPAARFIVTSRPEGLDTSWFDRHDFDHLELDAMGLPAIQSFVHRWYLPLLSSVPGNRKKVYTQRRNRLLEHIASRPLVRDLAETPLLCAMLCAFYAINETVEPRSRAHLYEQVINALTNAREIQRQVPMADQIDLSDKRAFLQAIARYMADNALTTIRLRPLTAFTPPSAHAWDELREHDRGDVTVHELLTDLISGFVGSRTTVDHALRYVAQRSAVLQHVGGNEVQFAHRTFQEYLAACDYADRGEAQSIVPQLRNGDPIWWRIAAFAAAKCNRRDASALVRSLMAEADSSPDQRRELQLLIAECVSTAKVELEIVEPVRAHLAEIFPPRDRDEAAKLVRSRNGDHVLGWLAGHTHDPAWADACIVAAAHIGTPEAMTLIRDYAVDLTGKATTPAWAREVLTEVWDRFDPTDFARRVLSEVTFGDATVHIDTAAKMKAVGQLPAVRRLVFGGSAGSAHADLDSWKGLHSIEELDCTALKLHSLDGIDALDTLVSLSFLAGELLRDFTPLSALTGLRHLFVLQGRHMTDGAFLAPLRNLQNLLLDKPEFDDWSWLRPLAELRNLQVSGGTLHDLDALRHLGDLRTLRLNPTGGLYDAASLTELRSLRRLNLTLAADRPGPVVLPDASESRLREVTLNGRPTRADVQSVASCGVLTLLSASRVEDLTSLSAVEPLHRLRQLKLENCRSLTAIDGIGGMRDLRRLDLSGSAVQDLAPLTGLTHLEEVVLERCSALTNIEPLLSLPALRRVSFDGISDWLPLDVIDELKDARSVNVNFDSYLMVGHGSA
ncbi:NACHT domain-containing protein [Streptomyces sp. NBC_01477]|uniref:NACHT domain-containing protein n=1 Tax=Streptomyces sp. NBC_01477 TaxID=2976015 RepID=UPI002E2FC42A|nr:NACHT domain-containing protein [Streptomyces sp. NBC_01477]